ncbi:hypothetical protein KL864_33335 [Mycolicibacterium goodii]|uniref:hypothetical protein n=1 Tax=Mycolicibacterium goodii TaxID=134601 RepID=UPI001BDD771F|nr:hypothetical protein [Mycolicibacterium goodii]MBU8820755.1 hypothetical protein [Mycolicibacterium goodii]
MVALMLAVAGVVVPVAAPDSAGVVGTAAASPSPGKPGGNHSKPGDNKKKNKKDQKRQKRSSNSGSSRNDHQSSSDGRGADTSSSRQPGDRSSHDQSRRNNRWKADGPNRSVDVRVVRDPASAQQAHQASRQPQGNPSASSQNAAAPVAAEPTATTPAPPVGTETPSATSGHRWSTLMADLGPDGNYVAGLAERAAPLARQLDQLQAQGWTIRYATPADGPGSVTKFRPKEIVIDSQYRGMGDQVTQTVAHEVGHAIYGDRTDYSSREAYVNSMLANEGAATLNNIQARNWILSSGGPDIGIAGNPANYPSYEVAYTNYIRSDGDYTRAIRDIGKIYAFGEHPSTNPAITYYQYYGENYDKYYGR